MPTVSEFWDGRAQNYDAQVGASYAKAYEMTADRFKQYLKPTDTVLDFACGTGIVTLAVAPAVKSVRAIDVSGEMVRRAQEKTEAQGMENVTVTQTDLFDTCLAEESFDAVLACNVLLYIQGSYRGACAHPRAAQTAGNAASGVGLLGRGHHARAHDEMVRVQDRQAALCFLRYDAIAGKGSRQRGIFRAGEGEPVSCAAEPFPCGKKSIKEEPLTR